MDPTPSVPPTQPVAAPTGDPAAASSSQAPFVLPSPAQASAVNPAQAQSGQNLVDPSGMIATYEQRIRTLMSDKDKAIYERNTAITAQAEMQKQLTDIQSQASTTVASTTTAAQAAIDESQRLRARVTMLEAEQMRAQVVLSKPHLASYLDFLPATNDAEQLNAAVAKLEQIREADIARSRGLPGYPPPSAATNPALPGTLPTTTSTTTPEPNLYALYGQRPNVPPMMYGQQAPTIPGSSPAMMNPAGAASNTLAAIDTILKEAMASGDPAKFEAAVQQTRLLAEQDVNRQIGRIA